MSWLNLYVKDLRLTKISFFINMLGILMFSLLTIFLMERYSPIFLMIGIPLLFFHVFYLFFMMYTSLRKEWNSGTAHLWLNIPRSGGQLLSAKFLAASTYLVISLGAAFLIVYLLLRRGLPLFDNQEISTDIILELFQTNWWVFFLGIIISAMNLGAALTFIYIMSKSIQKWGWLLAIAILSAASWVLYKVEQTKIYQTLTEWGVVFKTDILESILIESGGMTTNTSLEVETVNETLYLGSTIIEFLSIIVLLYLSAWLLDHKVNA